jgi:hypothetical protein
MRLAWSHTLPAVPVGLSLAREAGTFLVWDADHHLSRHDRFGNCELRQRAPASLVTAAFSDDGRSVAVIGKRGQVWLCTLDLVPLWERSLSRRTVALALDHLGQRVAVADEAGGVHLFDRSGRELWNVSVPRPLVHLAFVPEAPFLIGCADFGLVCALDKAGQCLWRDGLVAHIGSMVVTGDATRAVLACFTEGLCCYEPSRGQQTRLARAAPARLAAVSWTGEVILTVGLDTAMCLRNAAGDVQAELTLPASPVSVAVDALGRTGLLALAGGQVVGVDLPRQQAGRG